MQDLPQERLIENTKPLPLPAAKHLPESASLRQGAELALKDNWFRSAFEHAAIGMALADLDGRCLAANRPLCEMLGYTEAELLGVEFLSLVHPDDREVNLRCRRQLLAGEIPAFTIGRRYFHKRGHVIWTLLTVSLARDAQGHPLYIISQVQDITEQQRQNAALRESEGRYRSLIETLVDGIMLISLDGQVLVCNPQTAILHGFDSAEKLVKKTSLTWPRPRIASAR